MICIWSIYTEVSILLKHWHIIIEKKNLLFSFSYKKKKNKTLEKLLLKYSYDHASGEIVITKKATSRNTVEFRRRNHTHHGHQQLFIALGQKEEMYLLLQGKKRHIGNTLE